MPRASWSALLVLLSSSTILIAAAASDHPAIAALEEMEATIASHLASARRASGGATPPPGLPPLWANWEAHLFARARDRALDAHAVAIAADPPDAPRSPERAPAPLAEFESALRTARSDAEARLRAELFDLEPFASAPDANGGALAELRVELDARERAARLARAAAVERLARDAEEDARVRAHRAVAAIPVPSTDAEIDRAARAVAIASADALARTLEPLGFEPRETRRRALKTLRDACDAFAVAVKRASERATERALDAAFQSATREYDLETVAGFVRAGADPATVSKNAFKIFTHRSSRPADGFVPLAESTLAAVDAAARAAARRAFDAAARSPAPGILDDADATERLAGWIARSRAAARRRASLERELERRGEARVARNARAWHEALAPVNEAAIAAVERRLASPSSALALVASNVPWAFDGLARREWLNALDELVGAEEARAASNASFARDLRARPRNSAALRAMTRRSSRRVAAVFAREDEAMRRKRAEVRARFRWRVATAACACPPLARLASILRQKKKSRRRRSGPREKKRSKGSVPSSPSSPSSREKTTPRESRRSSWASRVRARVNPILFAAAQPLPEGARDEHASDENADENRRAGKGFVSRFPLRPRARDASRG